MDYLLNLICQCYRRLVVPFLNLHFARCCEQKNNNFSFKYSCKLQHKRSKLLRLVVQ